MNLKNIVLSSVVIGVYSLCIANESFFSGMVKPVYDIELAMPIDGPIKSVFVKEGDIVKKGEKILQLDNKLQELETQRRKIVLEDKSKVESLKNQEEILKSLLQSTQELYENSGAVSKDEVDSLKMKYYSTSGELESLQNNEAKEMVEYEISKEMLDKYTLKTPTNGVVTEIKLNIGEWARVGETVVRIVNSEVCTVDLNIEKEFIHKVKKGQNVNVEATVGDKMVSKKGKVIFISPIADLASGLVSVKVEFKNTNLEILPGVMANINLE
ncbi:MAG: efflux RND transporter periplasmic adaptor subunit [Campylobacterales bacterium]|nr:efflux RND transporter periplasmic adaptor subunit [Campylobacterales bacterium]